VNRTEPSGDGRTDNSYHTRVVLDSIASAFLVWLVVNPLFTLLSPSLSPLVQAAMVGHQKTGFAFLVFLLFFHPLHILTAGGFTLKSGAAFLCRLGGVTAILAGYVAAFHLWGFDPESEAVYAVVAVFVAALLWKEDPSRKRVMEFVLVGLALVSDTQIDHLGRILIFCLFVYSLVQIAWLLILLVRRRPGDIDPVSHLMHYATLCMALFAFVIFEGTGPSGPYREVYFRHILHSATAVGFLALLGVHIVRKSRRMREEGRWRPLWNRPVFAVALGIFALGDVAHAVVLTRYATPIVDIADVAPFRPTVHANLQGYRKEGVAEEYRSDVHGCGGMRDCHDDLGAQHDISAHGRAFTDEKFQRQLRLFIGEKGRAAADYCLACHAPIGVIDHPGDGSRGPVVDPLTTTDPSFTAGVGCIACHRATPVRDPAGMGNASLTIAPIWLERQRYLGETVPDDRAIYENMLVVAIPLHVRQYRVPRQDWDSVCAACHLVDLPAGLADDGQGRRVADQYSSFAASPYARAGLTCAACHQQRMSTYENGNNTVAHNYLGSGTSLPYDDKAADGRLRGLSMAFLGGLGDTSLEALVPTDLPPCIDDVRDGVDRRVVDREGLRTRGESNPFAGTNGGVGRRDILGMQLAVLASDARSLDLRVQTTNACDGHAFPSGGGIKAYLAIDVRDQDGAILGSHGGLGADGRPLDLPTTLGTRSADVDGNPVSDRRFWKAHELLFRRVIEPGQTVQDDVRIEWTGPGTPRVVDARWGYLRPERLRDLEEGGATDLPPVVVGRQRLVLTP
jgi:hypothetical protein